MDVYSLKELTVTSAPYALSPIPGPKTKSPTSWITKLLGVREVPDLGILTTHLGAAADRPLVHRTWGESISQRDISYFGHLRSGLLFGLSWELTTPESLSQTPNSTTICNTDSEILTCRSPWRPLFLRPQFPLQRVHESAKLSHCHIPPFWPRRCLFICHYTMGQETGKGMGDAAW